MCEFEAHSDFQNFKIDIAKVRAEQEEQTKLLKRLQRKLLLVTKERDSYKGVLDSYEKEVTLSGQEMDKERFAAQERTLEVQTIIFKSTTKMKGLFPT